MAIVTFLANVMLSRLLLHFGLIGLAAAFSLACFLNTGVLLWLVLLALPELRLRSLLSSHLRVLSVSIAAGWAGSFLVKHLGIRSAIESFAATIILIGLLYLGISLVSGCPEIQEMREMLHRHGPRPSEAFGAAG